MKFPHTRNRFAKRMEYLNKLFELWKFEFFQFSSKTNTIREKAEMFQLSIWVTKLWKIPSYINDRIGLQKSVNFLSKLLELWNLKYNKFFSWNESVRGRVDFFKQASQALDPNLFNLSHTWNQFAKRMEFLSEQFELWKFAFFQCSSKTKRVCKKAEIFQLSIWGMKVWSISSYIHDRIG